MATIKVFSLGGLDKKSNDLTRATDKASDMVNMEYDTQSTIKKRNGFAEVVIDGASTAAFNDIVYYNSKDEILGFTNGSTSVKILKRGSDFTTRALTLPSGISAMTNISMSYCENQNNLYFTNTDFLSYVMKYDGSNLYRSGLPTPRLGDASKIDKYPTLSNEGAGYTRIFYSQKDINGNITYSPYKEYAYQSRGGPASFIFNTLKADSNCLENGFLDKFCYVTKNPTMGTSLATYSDGSIILDPTGTSAITLLNSNMTSAGFAPSVGDSILWGITTATIVSITSLYSGGDMIYYGDYYVLSAVYTNGPTGPVTVKKLDSLSSVNRTLTVLRHNYQNGEKFLIDTENVLINIFPSGKNFLTLEIESHTPTSITFTASSFGIYSFRLLDGSVYYSTEYPVDVRTKMHIYVSNLQATNYSLFNILVVDNSAITQNTFSQYVEGVLYTSFASLFDQNLEDLYDSAYLKLMPPICKYIASYGNQIAYASIQAYFTGYTNLLNAPNQRIEFVNTSLITYSDTSTGDGPEGTSDYNFTKIGETWDGDITGIRRCNDALVILKNRGVFSIDGTLIDGQYSLRKINSNFVGCTSHKSILDADEGIYFQGHNGLYFTNGVNITKLSYEIDSVFLSGTYLNTRSVRLKKKQKSLFYVPDILSGTYKIVIIDYYYQQIYMWNSATLPSSGIVEDKNGDVYFCDGTKMYKFNDAYTDNGTVITSLYSTTWHHAGEPSLNKKWLSLRTFGLTNDAFTAIITTEGDWQAGTALTTNSSVYSSTTQTDFKMLDMQTKKSLRINFSNSTNNENMVLTGYELTYEMFNVVDKN